MENKWPFASYVVLRIFLPGCQHLNRFYVPALERSRERATKLANELESERKANEYWVQLELFEDLE